MSNKYFEEYTPEEYKQLSVALTLANAKLSDMYMLKQHSDFQILQSRITEQVNKAEALRQIKENELTLNPKVVSYLFNSPAQAQQQAQQQLQQIQNPVPVGIPALPPPMDLPDVDGERKADAPDEGEDTEGEDLEDYNKNRVEQINNGIRNSSLATSIQRLQDDINVANNEDLNDMLQYAKDILSLKGLSQDALVFYNTQKNLTEAKMLRKEEPAKPAVPAPEEKELLQMNKDELLKIVFKQYGNIPYINQRAIKSVLIEILEQNMTKDQAAQYIDDTYTERVTGKKMTKAQIKDFEKRRKKLDEDATPVPGLIRTASKPLTPRPPDAPARPATNIPVLADEGKKIKSSIRPFKKKTSGKGLKYKKTPKKLLMLGSAHAGNNNKKMLKMLKRKK